MSLQDDKFIYPQAWDNTSEFNGMGNFGKPDTPGLSTVEMQKVMDELPRYIAARINMLVDDLLAHTDGESGADQIGATAISGLSGNTVQALLESLANAISQAGGGTTITYGTSAPSGGSNGDVYIQYTT